MSDSLIPDWLTEDMPTPKEAGFLSAVALARENRDRLANELPYDEERERYWNKRFVYEVTGVALALDIKGLPVASEAVDTSGTIDEFELTLAQVEIRLRVQNGSVARADTVELTPATRDDLRREVNELRTRVDDSELPDDLKFALLRRLDAVLHELIKKKRARLTPIYSMAMAFAAVPVAIGALADAPDAWETITKSVEAITAVVQHEKAAELERDARVNVPAPRLPDYTVADFAKLLAKKHKVSSSQNDPTELPSIVPRLPDRSGEK